MALVKQAPPKMTDQRAGDKAVLCGKCMKKGKGKGRGKRGGKY